MKVLLASLFLATALFSQSGGGATLEDWEDRLMATRDETARRALLAEAAGSPGAGARAFLERRLRTSAPFASFLAALEAARVSSAFPVPEIVLARDRELASAEDRRRLWSVALGAGPWHEEILALLLESIDRHRHDPRGEALLPLLGSAARAGAPRERDAVAALLLSLYEDPEGGELGARAFLMGRELPEPATTDFAVAALLTLDERFALGSARHLLDLGTADLDDLLLDTLYEAPGRFLAAGLQELLLDGRCAALRLAVLERVAEADGDLLAALREEIARCAAAEIDVFSAQAVREGGPAALAIAADRVHAGRLVLEPAVLRARLAAEPDEACRLLLLDLLATATAARRDRDELARFLEPDDADERHRRLATVAGVAPRSPLVADILLDICARRARDWGLRGSLLRALGAMKAEATLDLASAALDHERWQLRLAAIEALVLLGNRSALARLAAAAGEPRLRLARAAAAGLRRLTGRDFGTNPEAWMAFVARLPQGWRPLPHPDAAPAPRRADGRYEGRFYGLDLGSNRLVFVCDSSGSMAGAKIAGLEQELRRAVTGLDRDGAFNIVFFADSSRSLWSRLGPVTESSRKRALAWAERQRAGGGTNLWDGLLRALDDEEADTIVVLSDGQPSAGELTEPEAILDAVRRLNRDRRLRIHTVELGELGHDFLRRLAALGEGCHVQVPGAGPTDR